MIEFYIVYNMETGEYLWKANGPPGASKIQNYNDNELAIIVDYASYTAFPNPGIAITQQDYLPFKKFVIGLMNQKCSEFRQLHITNIAGQEGTYKEKYLDAQAWITAGKPADLTPYPYLAYESQQTNQTAEFTANDIITTAQQWRIMDAKIEGKRRGVIVAVNAGTNMKEIIEPAIFDWPAVIE